MLVYRLVNMLVYKLDIKIFYKGYRKVFKLLFLLYVENIFINYNIYRLLYYIRERKICFS